MERFCLFGFGFCGSCSAWDLSSLSRDQTCAPCNEVQSLNHWTAREVPRNVFFFFLIFYILIFGCAGPPLLCAGSSLSGVTLSFAMCDDLIAAASLVAEHRL